MSKSWIQPRQHLAKPQTGVVFDTQTLLLGSGPAGVLADVLSGIQTKLCITALSEVAEG